MSHGYFVTTYNQGQFLASTLAHLPADGPVVVENTRDFGGNLSRAWNHGIRHLLGEGCDVAIICNDDLIMRDDTGALLAEGLRSQPDWTERELLLLSARHAAPNDNRTNDADYALLGQAEPRHQPGPDFACFAVDHRLLEIVGPFDEDFAVYASDNDMHRRIQLAGYEAGAYAPYWHLLNGTIRASAERQAAVHAIFQADVARYRQKWGGWLGEETVTAPLTVATR